MPTTTNYGWTTPADTNLVKDGASAIRTLGTAIDTTVFNNASAAVQKSVVDAAGDLLIGTANDTVGKLAIGTANQQLRVNSGATSLEYFTPAAAGGMTLISETTASGVSTLSFTSIASSYKELYLVWEGITHSTSASNFDIRLNNDSGSNYAYGLFGVATNNSGGLVVDSDLSATGTSLVGAGSRYASFGDDGNAASLEKNSMGWLRISNYASTTKLKHYWGNWWNYDNNGGNTGRNACVVQGVYNSQTAITSIDIVRTGGSATFSNATNTTIRLYGLS